MTDKTRLPFNDRNAPPRVPPVVHARIRYAHNLRTALSGFGQAGGILNARDDKSCALLWSIKVYDNVRRPTLEGDVRDMFFRSMSFDAAGRLLIENEVGQRFAVDTSRRAVTVLP
ncbi:hypothetical protein [Nevskia sp.]|uniref:hypothetical protein n=1 Tax=Nevskia sp. TaxID=1929292 RepID=UPI0025F82360|nr:hypothetical protein [Nevskia sp.]